MPAQPCENDYLLDYIARHSLARVDGGWTRKFDDQLFKDFQVGNMSAELGKLTCRVGVIYGDRSELFTPGIASHMFQVLRRGAPFIAIPEAHHHLLLDQPLAFVAAVRALLEEWRHAEPRPRK
jgi:pimeloyl-ACP methyl ester carboxylesterase